LKDYEVAAKQYKIFNRSRKLKSLRFSMSSMLPAALHSQEEGVSGRCQNETYRPRGRNDKSWHEDRIL